MKLSNKQKLSVQKINEFIENDKDFKEFYLLGYAGTGKTFLISYIMNKLLKSNIISDIYVCAPTHKALNVIESYFKSNLKNLNDNESTKIKFITIHKLLEFKPVISNDNGIKIFKSDKESKFLKQAENKLIIIDECSMISLDMVKE